MYTHWHSLSTTLCIKLGPRKVEVRPYKLTLAGMWYHWGGCGVNLIHKLPNVMQLRNQYPWWRPWDEVSLKSTLSPRGPVWLRPAKRSHSHTCCQTHDGVYAIVSSHRSWISSKTTQLAVHIWLDGELLVWPVYQQHVTALQAPFNHIHHEEERRLSEVLSDWVPKWHLSGIWTLSQTASGHSDSLCHLEVGPVLAEPSLPT